MQTQTGDDLIERIRTHPADDEIMGEAANDLLSELYAGYPVENLARLLHSGEEVVVGVASWLLSELAELAAPMMDELPALLSSPVRNTRYNAITVALASTDGRHGPILAQVINLSLDPDRAIRWKILEFLTEASIEQLEAGASCLPPGQLKELVEWLILQDEEESDRTGIVIRMEEGDPLTRLFAGAAAASLSHKDDTDLLAHAAMARDEAIRSFAQTRLERLREDD
ncbi:hypothetical protein AB0L53_42860 [Nonomuraea sp. NPDC052129]|uniref:hypothetical protein n=1 Tax=unclassified Nonomuraea TaxID=2593643 RepID=UPI0033F6EF28